MKYLAIVLGVMLVGCATPKVAKQDPAKVRRQQIYRCVLQLIGKEVPALEAEKVCNNIFSRRRVS